jgi:hypothetical protein
VSLLDRFGIRLHLTGGIASVAYGEPRLPQDIGLVVQSKRLIAVESDFVADQSAAGLVFGAATVHRECEASSLNSPGHGEENEFRRSASG